MKCSGLLLAVSVWPLFLACKPAQKASAKDAGDLGQPVAHLEHQRGEVSLERGGKKRPASLGYLYIHDALETGPGAEAWVRLGGGRVLELGPEARLVLGEDQTGLLLEVARGLLLTRVPSDAGNEEGGLQRKLSVSILTPFGLTRLGSSPTELSLEVGKSSAKLDVRVGSVELLSRGGEILRAEAGDKLSLTAGKVEFASKEPPSKPQATLSPIDVVLSRAGGRVEVKKAGQKSFGAVRKAAVQLQSGDVVRVKAGSGELSLSQSTSRLELSAGAELTFDRSERSEGVEESHLGLRSGSLLLSLPSERKSRVELGGLLLESDLGGQFTILRTRDGFEATSRVGDARLRREDGSEQLLAAGHRIRFSAKGAKDEEVARADLSLPSHVGLRVFHPGLLEASVTWDGPGEWFVLAQDSSFTQVIMSGAVHGSFVNVPIPARGSLYWRVQSSTGKEVDRGSAYFAPEPLQKDLARLRNEVPEGTDTTTIFFQDRPPAVTFTFAQREEAITYRVAVYRTQDLSAPVAQRTVSSTQFALEAGALSEGSYRWSVTPLLKDGSEGEGGRMNKLEMVYDNSVPQLIVRSPRNGDRAAARVQAAGVAPVGSRLTINGKPVTLDEKHRFDTEVIPLGRGGLVVFRMTRTSEPDVLTVRELRRGR